MGPIEKWVGISVFLCGVGVVTYAGYSVYDNYQARNRPAWTAGFKSADEMAEAKTFGFIKASDWRAEQERRATAEKKRIAAAAAEAERLKTKQDAIKLVKEAYFQEAVRIALTLRESMKNPDSFSLENVVRTDDGALCYDYRATNSFNAIIPGHAVIAQGRVKLSGQDGFNLMWRKNCAGHSGESIENVGYAIKNFYPRNK